jgi:hypothetical protein
MKMLRSKMAILMGCGVVMLQATGCAIIDQVFGTLGGIVGGILPGA